MPENSVARLKKSADGYGTTRAVSGMATAPAYVPKRRDRMPESRVHVSGRSSHPSARKESFLGSGYDGFTPTTCLAPDDRTRNYMLNRICSGNIGQAGNCPAGYASYGYQPVGWNFAKACNEVDMICVQSQYPTDTLSIQKCCTGQTPQAQCASATCQGSQACRDQMTTICDTNASFLDPNCQTWMMQPGNQDIQVNVMGKRCTAGMIYGDTPCRRFAASAAGKGQMDSAMISYCTTPAVCSTAQKTQCTVGTPQYNARAQAIGQQYQADYIATWGPPGVANPPINQNLIPTFRAKYPWNTA